jgi:hypothetical protein
VTGFRRTVLVLAALTMATPVAAQRPQPFPSPGQAAPQAPPAPLLQTAPPEIPTLPPDPASPTDATLGMPIYPAAQFLASYDAGRGQRYYVFGTTATFDSIVTYYRSQLDERGNRVFDAPPTHVFEYGRFNDDTMAFPPGVTVKDWTWGGSLGYPNPRPDPAVGLPDRFPTVFVMVPPPAAVVR